MFTIGLPKWAMESTDPYICRLVDESYLEGVGHVREFFDELIAGGACQDALLMQHKQEQDRRLYKSAYDDDDALAQRALEVYASHAVVTHMPVPDPRQIAKSVDRWEPGPDDIVLALELKGEQDFAAALLSEDTEREADFGQETARVDPNLDAIGELMRWAGRVNGGALKRQMAQAAQAVDFFDRWCAVGAGLAYEYRLARDVLYSFDSPAQGALSWLRNWVVVGVEGAQALVREIEAALPTELGWNAGRQPGSERVPLATVLATIKARWDSYSDAQHKLVAFLIGETQECETSEPRRRGATRVDVPVRHRKISTLYERANHAETQALIEEALDCWEEQQAERDEEAHPQAETAPQVQVALDNQARFLNWVAKGAQPAAETTGKDTKPSAKPWLARPTYIHVLDYAMSNGARTPREAHNRAYAADTLRLADRIVDYDATQGFQVMLNKEKQQQGMVPLADARVAYPHLPKAAQARLKALSVGQAQ